MTTPKAWLDPEQRARLDYFSHPERLVAPPCSHEWVNANLLGPTGYHCADCGEDCDAPSWMGELGFVGL